ncbi:hypothetical protein HU200_016053 [Digitaria exilis]|uniref:F-box domain-containing protein n=1 Tax=Digitaria exilis TaxID=1010633 RepID=A0A835F9B3_9POAL|nr:hypothetical protein HU200_016053 [Digitaria exilis]
MNVGTNKTRKAAVIGYKDWQISMMRDSMPSSFGLLRRLHDVYIHQYVTTTHWFEQTPQRNALRWWFSEEVGSNHMSSHDSLLLDLPDDILELILLTSTRKRWLRIVSSAGFNRRFRAIHSRRPVVAGSYYNQGGGYHCPRFEPSPATAAAVHARHFSLDFIPG